MWPWEEYLWVLTLLGYFSWPLNSFLSIETSGYEVMKNTSYSHFHGYVNSTLDNAVRVRLTNGQIVALKITPIGIVAQVLGQILRLPEELEQIRDVFHLVNFLKSHQLGLLEQEIIIERQTNSIPPKAISTSPPISIDDL